MLTFTLNTFSGSQGTLQSVMDILTDVITKCGTYKRVVQIKRTKLLNYRTSGEAWSSLPGRVSHLTAVTVIRSNPTVRSNGMLQ